MARDFLPFPEWDIKEKRYCIIDLSDIPDCPLCMVVAAVALALVTATKRRPKSLDIRKRDYFQLKLALQGVLNNGGRQE